MINNSAFSMGRIISTEYSGILNAGACIFGHFGDFRDGVESPGVRDRNIWGMCRGRERPETHWDNPHGLLQYHVAPYANP